jgi:hypothetical protein
MTEQDGREPGSNTYDAKIIEDKLGFSIAPTVIPHIIEKEESQRFADDMNELGAFLDSSSLPNTEQAAATLDAITNRAHNLLGSVWLRENQLLLKILSPDVVEQGMIEAGTFSSLSGAEKDHYMEADKTGEGSYQRLKNRLEVVISTGFVNEPVRLVSPTTVATISVQPSTLGDRVEIIDYRFKDGKATGAIDAFIADEPPSEELDLDLIMPQPLSIGQVEAIRQSLAEANRRLAILDTLSPSELKVLINQNLINPSIYDDQLGGYQSWDRPIKPA